jgi:hypothetical protein
LVERKPALVDLEAIELYEDALGEVLPNPGESWEKIIGEIRWQCVKSTPKNEDLAFKCFQSCLLKDDLEHARQVSSRRTTAHSLIRQLISRPCLKPSIWNSPDDFFLDCKYSREEFSR